MEPQSYDTEYERRAVTVPVGSDQTDLEGNVIPAGKYVLVTMRWLEPIEPKA